MLAKAVHDCDLFNRPIGSRPAFVASFARQSHFGSSNERRVRKAVGRYRAVPEGWGGTPSPFDDSNEANDVQVVTTEYENGALLTFNNSTHTDLLRRRMYIGTEKKSIELGFHRNKVQPRDHHTDSKPESHQFDGRFTNHYGAAPRQATKIVEFSKNQENINRRTTRHRSRHSGYVSRQSCRFSTGSRFSGDMGATR